MNCFPNTTTMNKKSCFEALGLEYPGCTLKEVRQAYRRMARTTHPDRFQDSDEKEDKAAAFRNLYEDYEQCCHVLESSPALFSGEQPPASYYSSSSSEQEQTYWSETRSTTTTCADDAESAKDFFASTEWSRTVSL